MGRKRTAQTEQVNEATAAEPVAEPVIASEAVGDESERRYPPEPNPRSWVHHNQAGVRLRERREPYQSEILFAEKPSQEVIDYVKDQGFRWNGQERMWTRPVDYVSQAQDRLVASRTYSKVVDMILQEKGVEPERTPF
jgi:hypothetical protein